MFLEKLLNYYKGNHLLLQGQDQYPPQFECTDKNNYTKLKITNDKLSCKLRENVILHYLKNKSTKYCEVIDYENLEPEDDDYLSDDDANQYNIYGKETETENEENINYDDLRNEVDEQHSDYKANKYSIQKKETENENVEKDDDFDDLNTVRYDKNDDRNNECRW